MTESVNTISVEFAWVLEFARRLLELSSSEADAKCNKPWQRNLVQQQSEFRHRSRQRFPSPNLWLWTDRSLAQSSDWWSAQFKATLFAQGERVLDGCCGAGVDSVALARRGEVIAVDCDPTMTALTSSNAQAHSLHVETCSAAIDRELMKSLSQDARWLHIDPDRRPANRRTTLADEFSPSLSEIIEISRWFAGSVVKLAPSTRMSPELEQEIESDCQRMWLGNRGECRQQLLLIGCLPNMPNRKRTAVLVEAPTCAERAVDAACKFTSRDHTKGRTVQFSSDDQPDDFEAYELQPGNFVADLHAVLHAAELQVAWANENGWRPLGGIHGYFTSDSMKAASEWAQYFEVKEVLPWDDRKVRKWLRSCEVGTVEVKNRMVKLDANEFQRRYSGSGNRPISILVTRLGDRVRAIIAERV